MTIFDIETGGDTTRARALMPAFEEGEVKVGNIKDEQKIKEKRAERRASYEAAWIDGAALRPETGRVLAIGVLPFESEAPLILHVHQSDEADVIQSFWDFLLTTEASTGRPFAGWSIFHFDLPFLVLRSRMLDVPVPPLLRNGRYFRPPVSAICRMSGFWEGAGPRSSVRWITWPGLWAAVPRRDRARILRIFMRSMRPEPSITCAMICGLLKRLP